MKTYEEFKENLMQMIKKYLPYEYKDYTIEVCNVLKVNQLKESLIIKHDKANIAVPNIYIRDFYEQYLKNGNEQEVIKSAADFYLSGLEMGGTLLGGLKNKDYREYIIMELINTGNNIKLLKNCPHRSFMDLSIIYRWILDASEDGISSAIVTDEIMKTQFGCDEEELYTLSFENTKRLMPTLIEKIETNFQVITNEHFIHGATSLIYKENLDVIGKNFKSNLYILPSSIHEVIAIPIGLHDLKYLMKMVEEANKTIVAKEDVLSDNVYFYDIVTHDLRIAIEDTKEKKQSLF